MRMNNIILIQISVEIFFDDHLDLNVTEYCICIFCVCRVKSFEAHVLLQYKGKRYPSVLCR